MYGLLFKLPKERKKQNQLYHQAQCIRNTTLTVHTLHKPYTGIQTYTLRKQKTHAMQILYTHSSHNGFESKNLQT